MFIQCSSEWQMEILHTGKKHTSPAAMGRRRLVPLSKRGTRQSTYVLSLSTQLPTVSRGQRDPSKWRSSKKPVQNETQRPRKKVIFRRHILRARWEEEGCLERVKKQPSRPTATLTLQPTWEAVINSLRNWRSHKVSALWYQCVKSKIRLF